MIKRIESVIRKIGARVAGYVRHLIAARKRRLEYEREFYRKLNAYCRANNVSPICEDDRKTLYYDRER